MRRHVDKPVNNPVGSGKEVANRLPPSEPSQGQTAFRFDHTVGLGERTDALYAAFRRAVQEMGGYDRLLYRLNKKPTYISRLSDGMARKEKRHVQLDWIAGLEPAAADVFLAALCEVFGYAAPSPKRAVVPQGELHQALLEELDEDGRIGRDILERAAKRCGTDVGAFRRGR